jgi:hypothetical protein
MLERFTGKARAVVTLATGPRLHGTPAFRNGASPWTAGTVLSLLLGKTLLTGKTVYTLLTESIYLNTESHNLS